MQSLHRAQKGEVVLVRCAAARASRREWICGLLWWCEGRVAGAGGAGRPWGASTGQPHYGFIHTAHLRSPISNLPFDPCRRQLRSPISNLDLQSPPRRWMPGARIYDLCSPSPISTFDPGNCQHDPREGWEDGTPPPHRDYKERCLALPTLRFFLCLVEHFLGL